MKTWLNLLAAAPLAGALLAAEQPLFQTDFQSAEVGQVPAGMLVLDGGFAVREEGGNKFMELPGAPLDSYGLLFGTAQKDSVQVSARVLGTGKGRRFPTFAIGLGGASGFRLQVSPGKKKLEMLKGEEDKASVPFAWQSGQWTHLKLRVRKTGDSAWKIEGKAWIEGAPEPAAWALSCDETSEPKNGRSGIFGSPYSGTPIAYDDLVVSAAP